MLSFYALSPYLGCPYGKVSAASVFLYKYVPGPSPKTAMSSFGAHGTPGYVHLKLWWSTGLGI